MVQIGGFLTTFDPLGFIFRSKNDKFSSEFICERIKEYESIKTFKKLNNKGFDNLLVDTELNIISKKKVKKGFQNLVVHD